MTPSQTIWFFFKKNLKYVDPQKYKPTDAVYALANTRQALFFALITSILQKQKQVCVTQD